MKRTATWRADLAAYIAASRRRKFEIGEFDCGMFVAGAIKAMVGRDLVGEFRGKYTSYSQAAKLLKANGFRDQVDVVAGFFPEIHPSEAHVGDVVSFEVEGMFGQALGLVNGEVCFVLQDQGLATMPLLSAARAFRV